jgi:hypothetical protein
MAKSETNSKEDKRRKSETEWFAVLVLPFSFLVLFGFVSDFAIRISDFD